MAQLDGTTGWGKIYHGAHTQLSTAEHIRNASSPSNAPEIIPPQPIARITTDGWSLDSLLEQGERFLPIRRVSSSSTALMREINKFDSDGIPLIIEGFHTQSKWLRKEFHPDWLLANCPQEVDVRNVHDWSDKTMSLAEFIAQSRASPKFAPIGERFYGKDAVCPEMWNEWLRQQAVIPFLLTPDQPENLLSSHVETLMCYLGIGDTFTPCHKDLCASSGQNLMCYTENGGSSFWFMTESSDAPAASLYFQQLSQELDHETHVISIEQLANAPFDVYISEQNIGDLVLVPPRSCHQVVNSGGITIKMSWSRMTLRGLQVAYYHELPIYRRVCRAETYRIKSTIYQTLCQRSGELTKLRRRDIHSRSLLPESQSDHIILSTEILLRLFDDILIEEYSPSHNNMPCLSRSSPPLTPSRSCQFQSHNISEGDVHLTCDFCGADIFQSFFECLSCILPDHPKSPGASLEHGDGFIVCAGCYVEGRSCRCGRMVPIQCWPFDKLLYRRAKVVELLSAHMRNPWSSLDLDLDSLSLSSTFKAACLLHQIRQEKGHLKKRACTSNHLVPFFSSVNCKKCHVTKCFMHALELFKLHTSGALLFHSSDSSHEEYHRQHLVSARQYDANSRTFLLSQRKGNKPDRSQQQVHLALQYGTCKPVAEFDLLSLGWYDVHAQILLSPAPVPARKLSQSATSHTQNQPMALLEPNTMNGPKRNVPFQS